jgi:GxxExxY protein
MTKDIEETARIIVDSVITVHKALGLGLLESAYQKCLAFELSRRGLNVACEVICPIHCEKVKIDAGYRMDMVIEDKIVIENKVVDRILPIHEAQLLTYLKLSDLNLGFILNWNTILVKYGIKRMVNNLSE